MSPDRDPKQPRAGSPPDPVAAGEAGYAGEAGVGREAVEAGVGREAGEAGVGREAGEAGVKREAGVAGVAREAAVGREAREAGVARETAVAGEVADAREAGASGSGSIDVELSGASHRPAPAVAATSAVEVTTREPRDAVHAATIATTAVPDAVPRDDSAPITSGAIAAPAIAEHSGRQGLAAAVGGAVSGGVEKLGSGVVSLGESVSKLGDVTRKVPLVGAGVSKLGEGISRAGESIHVLPQIAQTRRGRLLVRSVVVGFLLVFAWIAAIVLLQVRGNDTPDFRPAAEQILVELSRGPTAIGELYDRASPRFHELVRREQFIDQFTDLDATVGKFREIISINDTLVTTGPTGRIGRVGLTAAYANGVCRGSVSFHWHQGRWTLLGVGIELPDDLPITQAQRLQRVAVCKDPNEWKNPKSPTYCDARATAEHILADLEAGRAGPVWDSGTRVFKQQTPRAKFIEIQNEHREQLGAYKRIISVTEAKQYAGGGGWSATFDVLAEFEKSSGVRIVFGFSRDERALPWQLRSFKAVLPMPRADESIATKPPSPVLPPRLPSIGIDAGTPPADAAKPTRPPR